MCTHSTHLVHALQLVLVIDVVCADNADCYSTAMVLLCKLASRIHELINQHSPKEADTHS